MKVVVIEACALHLGYLGCYGNEWIATPTIDRLAAGSVVFDQHYADSPGSGVSSSWSGRYHFPAPGLAGELAPPPELLPSLLAANGISMVQVGERASFGATPGDTMAKLATTFRDAGTALDRLAGRSNFLIWVTLPLLAPPWPAAAAEQSLPLYFLAGPPEEGEVLLTPWFDPPCGPQADNDTAWQRLQGTYAAVITGFDARLGRFQEELERRVSGEELLFCVTASRGLALGEHGVIGECRPWLHDELVHLPFLVRLRAGCAAGRRVGALTQPVDILPTILSAFGMPLPESIHGHDLMPLIHGQADRVRDYACTALQQGERIEWGLRTPDWSFLFPVQQPPADPPRPMQLYVKPDDRWEVNDLRQPNLDLAERFEQVLRAFAAASREPGPLRLPALPRG
jgi:arylsulfatase A-like enzyme